MRFPAFFFGHGNPMNAIEDNAYSRAWRKIGASLPTSLRDELEALKLRLDEA